MRIDLSLIRQILLSIEEERLYAGLLDNEEFIEKYTFKDKSYYTTDKDHTGIFIYHLSYLNQKGLIKCPITYTDYEREDYCLKMQGQEKIPLTPYGHEWLTLTIYFSIKIINYCLIKGKIERICFLIFKSYFFMPIKFNCH